jgi:hypothetical protein
MKLFFVKVLAKIYSYFPSPLPKGKSEWNSWSEKIISLSGNIADKDSMEYVLASKILELKPNASKVPLNEFVRLMHKAAANQVASYVFQEIRQKQKDAQLAAATASKEGDQDATKN